MEFKSLSIIINRNTTESELQRIILTLWYTWRARNDARFKRKKWSVLQVHHAVEADIDVASVCARIDTSTDAARVTLGGSRAINLQEINSSGAGTLNEEDDHAQVIDLQDEFRLGLPKSRTTCRLPILLPGVKCYSDASILPDMANANPRKAGLGIFILDLIRRCNFFIKAQVNQMNSVLMAEAAGLALGASIISTLHIGEASFLSDNQVLVDYFNSGDLNLPPHWEIKPFTQRFLNALANRRVQVHKIARDLNPSAHLLATQALRHADEQCNNFNATCTNASHASSCPLSMALHSVIWTPFSLIAACCC
jgi:hypothetical protein